jgi:hypothetical protein
MPALRPTAIPPSADAPSNDHNQGSKGFIEQVLWPEFQELNAALIAYLPEITEKVIREEVHGEIGEADEVDEPARVGR